MFSALENSFARDSDLCVGNHGHAGSSSIAGLTELVCRFGGSSFERGAYRVVRAVDMGRWNARIGFAYPEFAGKVTCFGYDWLGRAFAAESTRREKDGAEVLMFDPGAGEALEVPCDVVTFHDRGLLEFAEAALARGFRKRWAAAGGAAPQYQQCIGYIKPLFLGGEDEVSNLALDDIDVYWHITGQLMRGAGRRLREP
ncbi:T6SS immunity protein Tdi1 domain-containing protein [Oricola sp.]|uniref:T6SS immunity protein Tdi1 domain-containing protein n=1 Tax=Oricola sp. TaxID=1979950 RepID=UPI0025D2BF20|nr:T6SS immunity protein Tdi1 domain-containing protein [Oricola sp.]MCI5075202.1 DUF1851 domain-containing protein [Oricola sp.]